MPPTIIAKRYRVDRAVGRGGMGTVWLCTDEVLGRTVAVKQVGHAPGASTPDLARALREARSAAALNHPNVVSIYDAIDEGDQIWLVMEYVPGRTLSEIMTEEGPLDPSRVAWIGAQVAEGLAAAHLRGTMHRDVKPGNILVADNDHAKISDFGIARTIGDSQLTQTGMVTGTPAYFSPELARGDDPSPGDDVWALGASLFAAVEGRPPWPEQSNALAMVSMIATSEPPRPERAGPLTEALVNMMRLDPAARWSMADVAYQLHRVHELQPVTGTHEHVALLEEQEAEPGDGDPVAAGDPRTLTEPVTSPDLTQELPSGPTVEATPDPAASQHHRDDHEAPRNRRRWPLAAVAATVVLAAALLWTILGQDDSDPSRPSADSPPSQGSRQDSGSDPDPTEQSPDAESSTAQDQGPPPSSSDSPEQFVSDYYARLPEDTESAWALLSSDMQAEVGSYDDYVGFWSTIDSVSVDATEAVDGDTVEVTLTYTTDGSSEQEVRQIDLAEQGDSFVIVGD